jgi:hypothetical protein
MQKLRDAIENDTVDAVSRELLKRVR